MKVLSKEDIEKQEHLDQTVETYYNKSQNSTPNGLKTSGETHV